MGHLNKLNLLHMLTVLSGYCLSVTLCVTFFVAFIASFPVIRDIIVKTLVHAKPSSCSKVGLSVTNIVIVVICVFFLSLSECGTRPYCAQ